MAPFWFMGALLMMMLFVHKAECTAASNNGLTANGKAICNAINLNFIVKAFTIITVSLYTSTTHTEFCIFLFFHLYRLQGG